MCSAPFSSAACRSESGTLYPILLSAAAQLIFLKTPPHAAIDLAVTLAQYDPKAKRYDKLVNAVLRRSRAKARRSRRASMPRGSTRPTGCGRDGPPIGARRARMRSPKPISSSRRSISPSRASLSFGPSGSSGRVLPTGSVRLLPKGRIEPLPGFDEGAWWVQDVAASLPARLLGDVAGKRVADLCAAPGGKTAQLVLAGASVVAVDSSKTRLGLLAENLGAARSCRPNSCWPTPPAGSRRNVRCGAARCALLIDRHHPPASRHSLYQVAQGHRGAVRPPGEAARQCRQAGQARRQARLFDLLARARGRRGANCGAAGAKRGFQPRSHRPGRAFRPGGVDRAFRAACGPFPIELELDFPEWSGMDGFFATRLVRIG